MEITIKTHGATDYCIYWKEYDGFLRTRRLRTLAAAQRFAQQLTCRLEMDAYRRELTRVDRLTAKRAANENSELTSNSKYESNAQIGMELRAACAR